MIITLKKHKRVLDEALTKLRAEHLAEIEAVERRAYNEAKAQFNEQVEQQANRMYSAANWLVNPNHIIQVTNSGIYLGLEKINKEEASQLKRDATVIKEMKLWQVLQETLRQKAIDKSVIESTDWNQVMFGKAMVHNLSIIRSIVTLCAGLDLDKVAKAFDKKETVL